MRGRALSDSLLVRQPASASSPSSVSGHRRLLTPSPKKLGDDQPPSELPPVKLPIEDMAEQVLTRILPLPPGSPPRSAGGEGDKRRSSRRSTDFGRQLSDGQRTTQGRRMSCLPPNFFGNEELYDNSRFLPRSPLAKQSAMLIFRQRLLAKFQTVKGAFECFSADWRNGERDVSRREFARFLDLHFPRMSRSDFAAVYEFLDADGSGSISVEEFRNAVEAASPVRNIGDLRRRWIALGFTSMRQALARVAASLPNGGAAAGCNITYRELAVGLRAVGVDDDEEHQAIFDAVRDRSDATDKMSMEMLASAVAAVSPPMLIEDLRGRLLRRFKTIDEALDAFEMDRGVAPLTRAEFVAFAVDHFRMTNHEARKAFVLMDTNQNDVVSRSEFARALTLSEPGLHLEELRVQVRQRFYSIDKILSRPHECEEEEEGRARGSVVGFEEADALGSSSGDASRRKPDAAPPPAKHSLEHYKALLGKLGVSQKAAETLFALIDVRASGKVTPVDFSRALSIFAPSTLLEDLRLCILREHPTVAAAFADIPRDRRHAVMDARAFGALLADMGLPAGAWDIPSILGVVETRGEGGITVDELVASLQSAGAGTNVPLSPEQRDTQAKHLIRNQLAPFRKSAREFRHVLRDEAEPVFVAPTQAASPMPNLGVPTSSAQGGLSPTSPAKAQARRQWLEHRPTNQSFWRVSSCIKDQCGEQLHERVQGYYVSASESMVGNEFLDLRHSRAEEYRSIARHRAHLALDRARS